MVFVTHAPDGQMFHQLRGRWGTDYGGRLYNPGRLPKMQERAERILVVGPDLSRSDRNDVGPSEKVFHCRDWGEALAKLVAKNGSGTKVGVYPYAPIQLPERLGEVDARVDTVTVCHHGLRSLHARDLLRAAGFTRVRSLAGGIDRWAQEVEPEMARY